MRQVLALLCSLWPLASAWAQAVPETLATATATRADTVRALANLFKSRRNTGGWLAYGSAGVVGLTVVGTLADDNGRNCGGYFCPDAAGSALLMGIGLAPAWIPGTLVLTRFNRRREQRALAAYGQTGRLPPRLQKRLAPRFFQERQQFSKPR